MEASRFHSKARGLWRMARRLTEQSVVATWEFTKFIDMESAKPAQQ